VLAVFLWTLFKKVSCLRLLQASFHMKST
jgi:hypothetical protein